MFGFASPFHAFMGKKKSFIAYLEICHHLKNLQYITQMLMTIYCAHIKN